MNRIQPEPSSSGSRDELFYEITKFYHQNENELFNESSTIRVKELLSDFSKEIQSKNFSVSNLTSEEILDFCFVSDSFLILLSRIMSSLENSFDFDYQKIKYNFTKQFENMNSRAAFASRSKSKFNEISSENDVYDSDDSNDDFIGNSLHSMSVVNLIRIE
jgi:FPC/CPF motif-containing protein YcgG